MRLKLISISQRKEKVLVLHISWIWLYQSGMPVCNSRDDQVIRVRPRLGANSCRENTKMVNSSRCVPNRTRSWISAASNRTLQFYLVSVSYD